jgi:hypothetical protein
MLQRSSYLTRRIQANTPRIWRGSIRQLSLKFVDIDDDFELWPRRSVNTLLNVCPQGEQMVIERLGKFHSTRSGGWFLAIPVIDNIRFVVDMRERALNIQPQSAITKVIFHLYILNSALYSLLIF